MNKQITHDIEYVEYILESVVDLGKDGWELTTSFGSIGCPKKDNMIPNIGQIVRYYGKGFGYPVRGITINNINHFYRSPKQEEQRHKKMIATQKLKTKKDFQKNIKKYNEEFKSLPPIFQERIKRFRKNNQNFRWDFEPYEIFCCKEAILIATTLKTVENIKNFYQLPYDKQRTLVEISDDHSGNSFGCSIALAKAYIENPNLILRTHGALCGLVGCAKYGCATKKH